MDLDERKAAILRAIVEEHVATAQPVGSQTVARSRGLDVSSATVRNEMTVLEREGYIMAPHTSAGRIPTDLGYRYFVDHFTHQGGLPAPQRLRFSATSLPAALQESAGPCSNAAWHRLNHTSRRCASSPAARRATRRGPGHWCNAGSPNARRAWPRPNHEAPTATRARSDRLSHIRS